MSCFFAVGVASRTIGWDTADNCATLAAIAVAIAVAIFAPALAIALSIVLG